MAFDSQDAAIDQPEFLDTAPLGMLDRSSDVQRLAPPPHRGRRWLMAVAAMVAIGGGVALLGSAGDDTNDAAPPETTSPEERESTTEPDAPTRGDDGGADSVSIRNGASSLTWRSQTFDLSQLPQQFLWVNRSLVAITPSNELMLLGMSGEVVIRPVDPMPALPGFDGDTEIRYSVAPGALVARSSADPSAVPALSVDAQQWFTPELPADAVVPDPASALVSVDVRHDVAVSLTSWALDPTYEPTGHVLVIRTTDVQLDVEAALAVIGEELVSPDSSGFGSAAPWTVVGDVLQVHDHGRSDDIISIPLADLALSSVDIDLLRRRRVLASVVPEIDFFAGPIGEPLQTVTDLGSAWFPLDVTASPSGFAILGTDVSLPAVRTSTDGITWVETENEAPFVGSFGDDYGTDELLLGAPDAESFGVVGPTFQFSAEAGREWSTIRTPGRELIDASTGGGVTIIAGWDDRTSPPFDLVSTLDGDGFTFRFSNTGPAELTFDASGTTIAVDPENEDSIRFDPANNSVDVLDPVTGDVLATLAIDDIQRAQRRSAANLRQGLRIGVTSSTVDSWTWARPEAELGMDVTWAETLVGPGIAVVFTDGPDGSHVHVATFGTPSLPNSGANTR